MFSWTAVTPEGWIAVKTGQNKMAQIPRDLGGWGAEWEAWCYKLEKAKWVDTDYDKSKYHKFRWWNWHQSEGCHGKATEELELRSGGGGAIHTREEGITNKNAVKGPGRVSGLITIGGSTINIILHLRKREG